MVMNILWIWTNCWLETDAIKRALLSSSLNNSICYRIIMLCKKSQSNSFAFLLLVCTEGQNCFSGGKFWQNISSKHNWSNLQFFCMLPCILLMNQILGNECTNIEVSLWYKTDDERHLPSNDGKSQINLEIFLFQ